MIVVRRVVTPLRRDGQITAMMAMMSARTAKAIARCLEMLEGSDVVGEV